jgi:hypothetical protein
VTNWIELQQILMMTLARTSWTNSRNRVTKEKMSTLMEKVLMLKDDEELVAEQ